MYKGNKDAFDLSSEEDEDDDQCADMEANVEKYRHWGSKQKVLRKSEMSSA
jgi:hypothetical protein